MRATKDQMKRLDEEIQRLDAEIARLQGERAGIMRAKALLAESPHGPVSGAPRKRSANVKPLVLDLMAQAGSAGATSSEVAAMVRERVPEVAKDTVGSLLSRLKADGAFRFDGERYYDTRFSPKGEPDPHERLKVVS